jgi:hypothetical protein
MPRQIHPSLYLCDPNLSIDIKGYYTSTRPDSYLTRKAMGSGPGHSGWKWLPFTMSLNTHGTWKCGDKCIYTYRGTGSPLDRSTLKGATAQAVECHFSGIKPWVQIQYSQKKKFGAEKAAQWKNICPACTKPWVQFPNITKSKKKKWWGG